MSDDDKHSRTTTFSAEVAGNKLFFSTKSMEIVIACLLTAAIGYMAVMIWSLTAHVELLSAKTQVMAQNLREMSCLQYIPEAERPKYVGQAAACRKMGEMQ